MTTPVIVLNLLLLICDVSHQKPVHHEQCPSISSREESHSGSHRVRRSIPDFDAVNPALLETDSFPDQEAPAGSQKDISPFALADVSNLFRSSKDSKVVGSMFPNKERKAPSRPVPGERAMAVAREVESVKEEEGLRSDEQEDCYRQQNMEPPGLLEKRSKTEGKKPKFSAKSTMKDVAYGPRTAYVPSNVLQKGGKHHQLEDGDPVEVHSLYSNPEKVAHYELKVKTYRPPKTPDIFNVPVKVNRPLAAHPEFPVYDEDIAFEPDPLQGILDDKYWLDPEEQEAVIRKYIDLAADNMMPPDVDVAKRGVGESEKKTKSVDSKAGFQGADANCPCKDAKDVVASCKDCKGKGQRNLTRFGGNDLEGISYGRKLLSMDYEENIYKEETKEEKNKFEKYNQNFQSKYFGRKLLYLDDSVGEEEDERGSAGEIEGNVEGVDEVKEALRLNKNVYHSRKILSYEENEKYYNSEEDDEGFENLDVKDPESNELSSNYDSESQHQKTMLTSPAEKEDASYVGNIYGNNNDFTNPKANADGLRQDDSLLDKPDKPPSYYIPNKIANVLQKPLNEKPKGPKKKVEGIDANQEFEKVQNETVHNITLGEVHEQLNISTPAQSITTSTALQANVNPQEVKGFGKKLDNINFAQGKGSHSFREGSRLSDGSYSYKGDYTFSNGLRNSTSFLKQSKKISQKQKPLNKRWDEKSIIPKDEVSNSYMGNGDYDKCSHKDGFNVSQYVRTPSEYFEDNYYFPQEEQSIHKRWDEGRLFSQKGRRSSSNLSGLRVGSNLLQKQVEATTDKEVSDLSNATSPSTNVSTTIELVQNNATESNVTSMFLLTENRTLSPSTSTHPLTSKKPKNKKAEEEEDKVDAEIANDIVESVISESQRSSLLGHHLGLCRRNESLGKVKDIAPETERIFKAVMDCIMGRLRSQLEKQSCVLLDPELLDFLKWMVLTGESYKDYMMTMRGYNTSFHSQNKLLGASKKKDSKVTDTTTEHSTSCEPESPPPLHITF